MKDQTTASATAQAVSPRDDVHEIKADIDRTQAELAGTMAELQQKLTVSHLVEQTKVAAREKLRVWGNTAAAVSAIAVSELEHAAGEARVRFRRDPMPLVLLGTGLGAALWHRARRRQRRARA